VSGAREVVLDRIRSALGPGAAVPDVSRAYRGAGAPGGGFAAPAAKQPAPPPVPYSVGDDVLHPSFGEGVVTGVEPGAVVVVRFAGDGAERKLMADYAPLKKVA